MDSLTPEFQFYRTDPRHVSKSMTLKARSLLTLYQQGKRVYSQIGQTGYLKIDLGMRWRLLSKDAGKSWLFMSHQTYDRELKR
ncbi:hypothetical protein OP063_003427 [Salmonella enterica subsp. enterica]|uniref:ParE-like toxin domain-containing protein n=1 Tax=Salmonella enterica TaxID=28901 RepID=A0A5U1JE03_SALER|nr:hypothetical protein [Salmonella enterica]ECH8011172.1 hypothetical protein [Salmonella enterica subsp. enterica serovar Muenchen]ECN5336108.1 hypothetical protein [Salmonella enterica subsp. enterica serovar Give]EDT8776314.1 hypothetical protein [Salmonella enterica subsp. enterica serovar Panama]EDX5727003.1 hypothetical protein [Salmonella enterica subsp. enterica serovar Sandiego]EKC4581526.1 hypothetical protein [Salmonella enterica subsp. enterica]